MPTPVRADEQINGRLDARHDERAPELPGQQRAAPQRRQGEPVEEARFDVPREIDARCDGDEQGALP